MGVKPLMICGLRRTSIRRVRDRLPHGRRQPAAALLEMDELARAFDRSKRRALVMAAGQSPLIVQRMMYFEDPMFAGMFDV